MLVFTQCFSFSFFLKKSNLSSPSSTKAENASVEVSKITDRWCDLLVCIRVSREVEKTNKKTGG